MKIICLSNDQSRRVSFSLDFWTHLVLPSLLLTVVIVAIAWLATQYTHRTQGDKNVAAQTTSSADSLIESTQNGWVSPVSPSSDDTTPHSLPYNPYTTDIEILTRRLGILEAEFLRLNAFGSRIVKMAKLDPDEFAFDESPSLGGAVIDTPSSGDDKNGYGMSAEKLMSAISQLESQLTNQRNRMEGMLTVLQGRILDKEVIPDSMPIKKGYISSKFGFRRDPFSGRKRMHKGIDFAGKIGEEIKAVAGGVVSFAGRNGGYGKSIEIDHGEGLVTRYAHLNKINVKRDQIVNKGELIGELGNTGRSTGPHLHLEVLKNGRQVNPSKYLKKK